ncbi:MAG TPA: hypothetical protein VI386_03645 [Candidatus Sulfotelmatobacter sp.]
MLQFRRLIGDAEHFWQKRYYDFNIRDHPQFVDAVCGEAALYSSQSGEVVQFESLRARSLAPLVKARGFGMTPRETESEWTAGKRERAAGKLCPAVELPHSSQRKA